MNTHRLQHSLNTLNHYLTTCFGLDTRKDSISASTLNTFLLSACAHNTYIETVSNKADTLHRYISESEHSMFTFSYLHFIKQISNKINLDKKKVVLAFDYTKETFWGNVNGFDIHGTQNTEKGTGAFKFLTCSQVSGKLHAKIPLISIPISMGHNKTSAITHCISLIKDYIGEIELTLFDREFYNKELMMTLNYLDIPYLIFVPKKKGVIKDTLEDMYPSEMITRIYKFDVNKHKTVYHDETTMAFLKAIFDGKTYEHFDWCFVTNVPNFDPNKMVPMYKCRWRIETGFRVQDEAGMKSKTTEILPRYFFFLYEQLLQAMWYVFYKKEMSFKQFIMILHNIVEEDKKLEGSKVHMGNN
jgi:hypothetical protein